MIVAPIPICLSVSIPKLGKICVFTVALIEPNAISPIFTIVPFVIVVVFGVVIAPGLLTVIVIRHQRLGRNAKRGHQTQAQTQDADGLETH